MPFNFKHSFISKIIQNPKKCLLISMICFIALSLGIIFIKSDFTPRVWFSPQSKEIKELDLFQNRFGSDQSIVLGFHSKRDVLGSAEFQMIKELTNKLELLPNVNRVESLERFNYIKALEDKIIISSLIEDFRQNDLIYQSINDSPELIEYLLSEDKKFTLLHIYMNPLFGQKPAYEKLLQELNETLEPYKSKYQFQILGKVTTAHEYKKISESDNAKILPLMFLLLIFLLYYFFRSWIAVFIPIVISIFTILMTLGLIGHFNLLMNNIVSATPGIILAICLADAVHILTSFYHQYNKTSELSSSLEYSLHKNFWPTIFTTITTMVSFITISNTELVPIATLGILSAAGCLLAWINTYLMLPSLLQIFPLRTIKKVSPLTLPVFLSHFFQASYYVKIIEKFKNIIIFIFITLTSIALFYAFKNEVNSDPLKYFSKETKIRKDYQIIKKYIKGVRGLDIVLDSQTKEGIKDPHFLQKVDDFFNKLKLDKEIIQIHSILDPIKKMNQELNAHDRAFKKIPTERNAIAQLLLLYTMGLPPGSSIDNLVSSDNRFIRAQIKWTIENSTESIEKEKWIHSQASSLGLHSKTGGDFPIYIQINDLVVFTFFKSMFTALALVSVIIFFIFKSPLLSIIAMLPNIIPMIWGIGMMYFMQVYLDIGTSIVAAVCLGIAIDDTIHFTSHFYSHYKENKNVESALINTFTTTGKALLITTLLLIIGFGSYIFADFVPNHFFGLMCMITLTLALITDLVLLPALLCLIHKKNQ